MVRALLFACALTVWSALGASAQALSINSPGTYTLTRDYSHDMTVVQINVSDVVLNLNGHTLRCTSANSATASPFGIAMASQARITVRNGAITGCFFGISGGYADSYTLEDLDLSGNTYIGANLGYGHGHIVRRVTCRNIGGYTAEAYAICINGIGVNGVVEDSTFENLYKQAGATGIGEGVGVVIDASATGVQLRRNTLRNAEIRSDTIGFWSAVGSTTTMANNTITNFKLAVWGFGLTMTGNDIELSVDTPNSSGIIARSGTATSNRLCGFSTPISGGIIASDNTIGAAGSCGTALASTATSGPTSCAATKRRSRPACASATSR